MEKNHELIEQTLCKELDEYEAKLRQGSKMEMKDYEILHHIYSILSKRATYIAMKEAEEYEREEEGFSGRRGRSPATGRYVSRDMAPQQSYAQGYSEGYSEAMGQMSGHHPMGIYPDRYRY
jgi:hypothetical protein